MIIIKFCLLLLIFSASMLIGIAISKKYCNREKELKEMKNALNMFETKIRFTYESIPEIFPEIVEKIEGNIGKIFENARRKMEEMPAGEAWDESIENTENNLTQEDRKIIKGLGRMLGKTDIEGQISEIELVNHFLDTQIELAEQERRKNEKMYKTLGGVIGLALVIILI